MARLKIANKHSHLRTTKRELFEGSNLWGVWCKSTMVESDEEQYVVYSYGHHYPMFIYAGGMWFENEDKSSQSTERQRSQCRPVPHNLTHKLNTQTMQKLAVLGITELYKRRILGGI